jgi:hypothetical protein
VDSLFKRSRPKIQQRHLRAAEDRKPCAASQLFVYRLRLFVKHPGNLIKMGRVALRDYSRQRSVVFSPQATLRA